MDSVLANAIARRDAAQAEAQRWDDFIRMFSELQVGSHDTLRPSPPSTPSAAGRSARDAGAMSRTEEVASEIIAQLGRPVPTRELLNALLERGVDVGGKDPASTLSARLSRAPTLHNIRQRGWWIRERTDDAYPHKDTSPARQPHQGDLMPPQPPRSPVEPGREVVHDNIEDDDLV